MKRHILLLVICLTCLGQGQAQTLQQYYQAEIDTMVAFSVDPLKRLFYADTQGNVHRLDSTGLEDPNLVYSPPRPATVSSLEAWNGLRLFFFFRENQQYAIADRFLLNTEPLRFPEELVGYATVATLSQDQYVWVLDQSSFSLKRINLVQKQVVSTTSLDLVLPKGDYEILAMREHQNQLYLLDRKRGVLVFDMLGNYRRTVPIGWAGGSLAVDRDGIYYVQGDRLVWLNLYTLKERSWPLAPAFRKPYHIQALGNRVWLYTKGRLTSFRLG